MPKKIAIVGCAANKMEAPFHDENFEIWGMNNLFLAIPRWDRWFELHTITTDGNGNYFRRWQDTFRGSTVNDYLRKIGEMKCAVYMQKPWPEIIPTSESFPLDAVLKRFPHGYFTNSVSYMLALAIMGIENKQFEPYIGIWGIDMAVDDEYHRQKPSVEWILGMAIGMGIEIHIPETCDLFKTRFLYGYGESEQASWDKKKNLMLESVRKKRMEAEQRLKNEETKINQYIGAELGILEQDKIWR